MANVPKIVKERLKAAAIAVDHPDPNVLTAFSEDLLADRERNEVLQHLARCADCREVLALAQPAQEPVAAVIRPIRRGWLSWPQLRWGLVAAGLIVVGTFGVLRYNRKAFVPVAVLSSARTSESAKAAGNQTVVMPTASEAAPAREQFSIPATKLAEAESKPQTTAEAENEFDRAETVAKLQASPGDKKAGGAGGLAGYRGQALPHGPMPPTQWQQNTNLTANAANQRMVVQSQAPAPAARLAANEQGPNGLLVSAQSSPAPKAAPATGAPVLPDKQAQRLDTLAVQGRSAAPPPLPGGSAGSEIARAKDAEPPTANAPKTQSAAAYDVSASSSSNFSASASLVPESARWSITSSGGLQQSFDQGKTWQDVDVNSGARDSEGVSRSLAMKSSRTNAALQKQKADLNAKSFVFRAVSANGPDVWAGGSEGNLYHSTDSGAHWVRILPSWRGVALTGDILSLQFGDTQHGRIVTSSAEIWTTADAGQTWDKQ